MESYSSPSESDSSLQASGMDMTNMPVILDRLLFKSKIIVILILINSKLVNLVLEMHQGVGHQGLGHLSQKQMSITLEI